MNAIMDYLSSLSDAALKEELARRDNARKLEEAANRKRRQVAIVAAIDHLLELSPKHDYTSCSDDCTVNSDNARCVRCLLLEIKNSGIVFDEFDIQIHATCSTGR